MVKSSAAMTARRTASLLGRLIIVIAGIAGIYYIELTTVQDAHFHERHGTLVNSELREPEAEGNRVFQDIDLTSSSGLAAQLRVLRSADATPGPLPLVLIIGGQRTGKHAVDLVEVPGNVSYAAIDYPYAGPARIRGFRRTVAAIRPVQRAILDTPPAISLAVDWLAAQPWVDTRQIELVGVSFGVPFAATAAAVDDRFGRVWLVHGAGDNALWAEHALRSRIENDLARHFLARLVLLISYGASFQTLERIEQIAPRPVVVISSNEDEQVPREGTLGEMIGAADAEVILTDGRHVQPSRKDVLGNLLNIVQTRIESGR